MGWSRGSEIFDSVAYSVVNVVGSGNLGERAATSILTSLATSLHEADWDTEDESAETFENHPFVIEALRNAGSFACDDPNGRYEHEDCSRHAACRNL